jgi:hypothetical protein
VASKPETTFIKSVHNHLPETYFEKTHNPYRAGIADVWYSGLTSDLWVEYKYEPSLPRSKDYRVKTTAHQDKWLADRTAEGRRVAVILGVPKGGIIMLDGAWLTPQPVAYFKDNLLPRQEVALWIYNRVGRSPCKSSNVSRTLQK